MKINWNLRSIYTLIFLASTFCYSQEPSNSAKTLPTELSGTAYEKLLDKNELIFSIPRISGNYQVKIKLPENWDGWVFAIGSATRVNKESKPLTIEYRLAGQKKLTQKSEIHKFFYQIQGNSFVAAFKDFDGNFSHGPRYKLLNIYDSNIRTNYWFLIPTELGTIKVIEKKDQPNSEDYFEHSRIVSSLPPLFKIKTPNGPKLNQKIVEFFQIFFLKRIRIGHQKVTRRWRESANAVS